MTINKIVKDYIDNLKVWDNVLEYTVTEIDWDIYTMDDHDNETFLVKDSGELFDMIMDDKINI